ncbi:M24 family metallopeptidase [Calycomorphotria hydatis]|uniref:Putative peptidase n=1 Tax=Calycomorphotria hydatis TaxID=2528027 RepID=A0A517TAE4_9PLAN|nr:M24 family metallopeptidase [Calycomorphotria hydatis]QDT65342.1 putative peptidase [Calycomorphotria hydatis]
MIPLSEIQQSLHQFEIDGWLLFDFRGNNELARRVLQIPHDVHTSRRWAYFIPQTGEPRKLCHRIESNVLDHLPGEKSLYLTWQTFEEGVRSLIAGHERLAMEYSPKGQNPYVSRVDAGTVELVKSVGGHVVSSGDLIQQFEATLSDHEINQHFEASKHTHEAFERVWAFLQEATRSDGTTDEMQTQQVILDHFKNNGLVTYHPPIVAVNSNSGNPHYETGSGENTTIKAGDFVLVDLWAKLDNPHGIYSDLTRVAFLGEKPSARHQEIFSIVAAGRDAAIQHVQNAFEANFPTAGWQVDRAARDVIEAAGFGDFFVHRTGHSIGQETHGNGAHMDDLETHETRRLLPCTLFSIEPGIYLPEFGVRSEVNVLVDAKSKVHVTGGEIQHEIRCLPA